MIGNARVPIVGRGSVRIDLSEHPSTRENHVALLPAQQLDAVIRVIFAVVLFPNVQALPSTQSRYHSIFYRVGGRVARRKRLLDYVDAVEKHFGKHCSVTTGQEQTKEEAADSRH